MKASIRLYDTVLHFPLPSWIDKDTRKLKKEIMPNVSRKQLKNKFIFLALPHKQTVHNWTSLFGIEAFYVGNSNIPLSDLTHITIQPFKSICGNNNLHIKPSDTSQPLNNLLVFCTNTPHAPTKSGYGNGVGEIGYFHFMRSKHVLVKVYEEWRGKQFSINNQSSWPVSPSIISEIKRRFQQIRLQQLTKK